MQANEKHPALPFRAHTILGVCEAIGEDFGFNPIWLRIPFAATVLLSPMYAIGAYLVLGVLVLASRLLFPKAKVESAAAEQPAAETHEKEERELPLAA